MSDFIVDNINCPYIEFKFENIFVYCILLDPLRRFREVVYILLIVKLRSGCMHKLNFH